MNHDDDTYLRCEGTGGFIKERTPLRNDESVTKSLTKINFKELYPHIEP